MIIIPTTTIISNFEPPPEPRFRVHPYSRIALAQEWTKIEGAEIVSKTTLILEDFTTLLFFKVWCFTRENVNFHRKQQV